MRKIEYTNRFKKDYRKIKSGRYSRHVDDELRVVVPILLHDQTLPERYRDHFLSGNWKDHRDCHLKPDLVLIYKKSDDNTLTFVRIGSHSKLGL